MNEKADVGDELGAEVLCVAISQLVEEECVCDGQLWSLGGAIGNCELRTASCQLQTADCRL